MKKKSKGSKQILCENSTSLFLAHSLREIDERDIKTIWRWRNHANVRAASASNRRITWDQHCYWFLNSPDTIKLAYQEDQKIKGVVTLDGNHYWSFYTDPSGPHLAGRARIMLSLALAYFKKIGIKTLKANYLRSNRISHYLHLDLGFERRDYNDSKMVEVWKELERCPTSHK